MPTPSMEDYLECIYSLIEDKGYARVSDIAEHVGVHPSSVTKMIQRLDKDEYLIYEKYRGLMLTKKGKKIGKVLVDRHLLLVKFLTLIGVPINQVQAEVEGMEHHLSWDSIICLEAIVEYFNEEPGRLKEFKKIHDKKANEAYE